MGLLWDMPSLSLGYAEQDEGMSQFISGLIVAAIFDHQAWIIGAQIGSALGAMGGAVIALVIAREGWKKQEDARREHAAAEERAWRRQQEAEDARAQAQARLVLVNHMGMPEPKASSGGVRRVHRLRIINHSEHPILEILAQVWAPPDDLEGRHSGACTLAVILPGEEKTLTCVVPRDSTSLRAWQVRWTDHHGRQWRCDSNKESARSYDGSPPRE
ncbi:hypothetical protein GCM10027447_02140 [Glycomyces halotolerans]